LHTNSCGEGCVDYGDTVGSGHYTYARRSDGSRMQTDWDYNHRNQAFRGCVGIDYAGGATWAPMQCDQGPVTSCLYLSCSGNACCYAEVYHRNGDNNTHNLDARARR
jgi:hypothetical protein